MSEKLPDSSSAKLANRQADGYHTCYALAGLSSVQHRQVVGRRGQFSDRPLGSAFEWTVSSTSQEARARTETALFDGEDLLEPIHPIFVVTFEAIERARIWASAKDGF